MDMNQSNDFLMHADDPNESIDLRDVVDPVEEEEDVRAILIEDLEPTSPTFGAMSLGSLGFQIASERTGDDSDWNWTTFGNAQGFNADLITAGTLNAININGSNISGGTITGSVINNGDGTFRVDENGMLTATSAVISGSITGSNISGSNIYGGYVQGSYINGGQFVTSSQSETSILTSRMYGGYTTYTQTDIQDPDDPEKNSVMTVGKHGFTVTHSQKRAGIYPTSIQISADSSDGSLGTKYAYIGPLGMRLANGASVISLAWDLINNPYITIGSGGNNALITKNSMSVTDSSSSSALRTNGLTVNGSSLSSVLNNSGLTINGTVSSAYGMFYMDSSDIPNLSLKATNGTYSRMDNDEIWLYKSDGNYTRITNDNIYIYRNNSLAWKAI